MNTTRMISCLVCLFLFTCLAPLAAQPDKKPDEKSEDKTKAEASSATQGVVELDPKEIDKIAKMLGDWETLQEQALGGSAKAVRKEQKAKEDLIGYLEELRKGGRDPMKAVESWWSVYSSEKYRKFPGRSGRQMGQKMEWSWMGKKMRVVYHLFVPSTYRSKTPCSVVLCFHPREKKFDGERYIRQLWGEKDLSSGPMVLAPDFPDNAPDGARWSDRKMLYASMGVLGARVIRPYNVDWNGLFLDGYKDGATEAWRLASQLADNFAGVIIRGALPPEDIRFEDFTNTPFLLVGVPGAEMDADKARALGKKMKAAGVDVTVATLSEEPKPRRERESFKEINAALVEFLKKRRDPYPKSIDWCVKENNTRRCFYVRSKGEVEAEAELVEPKKPDAAEGGEAKPGDAAAAPDTAKAKKAPVKIEPPRFKVAVDRENNKLKIECHRILGFQVFLNDRILDLDRDVTFEVNGKVVYNGRPDRSFDRIHEQITASGDWTRVYPWSRNVKVENVEKPAGKAPDTNP